MEYSHWQDRGPNVVLAKQVFRQMTVAEMINSILKQGKDKGAGEFIVRSEKGRFILGKPCLIRTFTCLHIMKMCSR